MHPMHPCIPMQVGTCDGRVKIFGQLGVEKTLYSNAKRVHTTRQLLFLQNRGLLIRIDEARVPNMHACIDAHCCHCAHHAPWPLPRHATFPMPPPCPQAGLLDAWDMLENAGSSGSVRDLAPLKLDAGDKIRCAALLPAEPFLALGCASGGVRFAALCNASGAPVAPGRPARALKLSTHSVSASELMAGREAEEIDSHSVAGIQRLLLRTAQGNVAVWDIR
jgi:hypothetical protein